MVQNYSFFYEYLVYFSYNIQKVKLLTSSCFQRGGLRDPSRTLRARSEEGTSKKVIDKAFKRSSRRGPVTWLSLALTALAGGGLLFYVRHIKEEKERGDVEHYFDKFRLSKDYCSCKWKYRCRLHSENYFTSQTTCQ